MDIDIRDFAADHYAEANKRTPRPEIEAYIKAYDARRQADADARAAPTPRGGVKPRASSIPTTLARHTAIPPWVASGIHGTSAALKGDHSRDCLCPQMQGAPRTTH